MHLTHLVAEAHNCTGMVRLSGEPVGNDLAVTYRGTIGQWLVKLDDKPQAEALGHTATVARGITRDATMRWVDAHLRTLVKRVNHHIVPLSLWKGEPHHCGTLGGGDLGGYIVVGKVDAIVVRPRLLALVREPAGALVLVKPWLSRDGHDGELSIVVDPRTGLVRQLDAAQVMSRVGVGPAVAHLARLRGPCVHPPGQRHCRVGVARRQLIARHRPHQRVHIVHRINCRCTQVGNGKQ